MIVVWFVAIMGPIGLGQWAAKRWDQPWLRAAGIALACILAVLLAIALSNRPNGGGSFFPNDPYDNIRRR